MNKKYQSGNIVAYILIGFVLLGLLAATLRGGPEKDPNASRIDQMTKLLVADLETISAAISECTQAHPGKVDANGDSIDDYGNPNPPFPVYADMSSGGSGDVLSGIQCPGASVEQRPIFGANLGNHLNLLSDPAKYIVTYVNDSDDGVYIIITPDPYDAIWLESIQRINDHFAPCAAAIGGARLYFSYKRLYPGGGGAIPSEVGCPEPN